VVDGEWEFQSAAFDNATPLTDDEPPHDMSVALSDTLGALDRAPERLPYDGACPDDDPDRWGVAVLRVDFLRNKEQQEILRTPRDDEPAHGDVRGTKNSSRRRRLKKHAEWVVRPASQPQ
jgi:hypothetical protein